MNPLKITLTGFKGILAGMGLETFTHDLTQYNDAQLVAIGSGQTVVEGDWTELAAPELPPTA